MILLLTLLLAADLNSVMAEANAERRADFALKLATDSLAQAREASTAGDATKLKEHLSSIEAAVVICVESLDASGKSARKSPKHFKSAELRLRDLMRRLQSFSETAGVEDRDAIDATRKKVAATHEHLLEEIMTKK